MQDKYACTPKEFVLKYSLIYLGMKKTANEEAIDKIKASEENMANLEKLVGENDYFMFLFAMPAGANGVNFLTEAPPPSAIKKKCVLVLRARAKKEVPGGGELTD
jgi:hypothetical protein